jgi:hypothetical protein
MVLLGELSPASGSAAMRAFHRYAERFHQEAVFVSIEAAKNDVALRQLAGHRQLGGRSAMLHGDEIPALLASIDADIR